MVHPAETAEGGHLCLLFDSPEELANVVVPFVRGGLERGERVVCLCGDPEAATIRGVLDLAGVDLVPGFFIAGGEDRIGALRQAYDDALLSGATGLRVLSGAPDDQILSSEALLDAFLDGKGITVLCLYSRERCPTSDLMDGFRSHRHLVMDGEPCINVYYEPSGVLLESDQERRRLVRLEWMGEQLRRNRQERLEVKKQVASLTAQKEDAERAVRERQDLEAQLHHALRMEAIGRLAGGVAHDFNNLLTVIYGNCEIALEHEAARVPDLQTALKEIHDAAQRAATLTGQLLRFSRKETAQPEPLNLNQVIGTTSQLLRRVLGEDIQINTRLAPDLDLVLFDSGQLEQILMSLAVNARDAMPSGGILTVETANAGDFVLLSVSDSGLGMSAEIQARAFEPFFTTKEPAKGTGLGLSTVDDMVRRAGGRVQVQSALGWGATFTVYLPRLGDHRSVAAAGAVGGGYKMS